MVKALLAVLLLAAPPPALASALTNADQAYITGDLGLDAEILMRLEAAPRFAQAVHAAIGRSYDSEEAKKEAVMRALDAFETAEILKPLEKRRS